MVSQRRRDNHKKLLSYPDDRRTVSTHMSSKVNSGFLPLNQ